MVTLKTHLIPGDGVVEGVDGLVFARHHVTVDDIKFGLFLDHGAGEPEAPGATEVAHQNQHQHPSTPAPVHSSTAVFMPRFPATSHHHVV